MYSSDVNIRFGDILRKLRKAHGLSQAAFADLCQISRAYYGRAERGEFSLTLHMIQRIAAALNCRIADLFEDLDD